LPASPGAARPPAISMRTVLIANRGEIAVRVARACREAGLRTVAVYSEADRGAPHVLAADQAIAIGPPPARESYLNIPALLGAARTAGADAVHPGYGFLAESAAFAEAVEAAGLVWIGPPPQAIATMGDKLAARATVARAGVPLVPGTELVAADVATARRQIAALGYPVLVKAAGGGGGKGMRTVAGEEELGSALAAASREAESAFGDGRVYVEKLLRRPRHVEVQVLGDRHGHLIHLGERECSIQRRHQKIVEETPCPALTPRLRAEMTAAALAAARAVGYTRAGTVVPVDYDPIVAKISAWAADRGTAVRRLRVALEETVVLGPTTNLGFLLDVLAHPAFLAGDTHAGFLTEHLADWRPAGPDATAAAIAAAIALSRPAVPSAGGERAAAPTPWETLGAWRLGAQR